MKSYEILNTIKSLAMSQGTYSRLYRAIMGLSEEDRTAALGELEALNFSDSLEFILWYECGELPAGAAKKAA